MMESLIRDSHVISQRLQISEAQINDLKNRALGLDRADRTREAYLASVKVCPTRHGCSGATNCDYSLSGPIGR